MGRCLVHLLRLEGVTRLVCEVVDASLLCGPHDIFFLLLPGSQDGT